MWLTNVVVVFLGATVAMTVNAGQISPSLREGIASFKISDAIIELPQVISGVAAKLAESGILEKEERITNLVTNLQSACSHFQAPFVKKIEQLGLEYKSFWASNIIHVKGLEIAELDELALVPGEFTIREQKRVSLPPVRRGRSFKDLPIEQPTWGVKMIGANRAWLHSAGNGSIIGTIDTGVYLDHQSLRDNWAGGWADPVYNRPTPMDGHGHGTHVTGTACGRKGSIGVAPRAQWVACRGLDNQGSGTEADLTTCAEFMVTTTPMPQVVSCSWGGGQGDVWYNSQIQTWRAAGIIPVFAIGNDGSWCQTAGSPGDQPDLISVGATTDWDTMASFSSRGPSVVGRRMKPEVAAPGENILSADALQGGYVEMSGTSMATPHVAGAIAILLAKHPDWGYDEIFESLTTSAAHPELTNGDRNCGLPIGGEDFPNNAWGWGRIDVYAAILNSTASGVL